MLASINYIDVLKSASGVELMVLIVLAATCFVGVVSHAAPLVV